jgi:hypothetical protein
MARRVGTMVRTARSIVGTPCGDKIAAPALRAGAAVSKAEFLDRFTGDC